MNARELMSAPPITIGAGASIDEAVRLMLDRRLSGLPVVDEAGRLLGLVTEGDLLRRGEFGTQKKRARWLEFLLGPGACASDYARAHGRRVKEVMTDQPIVIAEDTPIAEIVDLMEKHRVKRLPVVRDDVVIGIVSRADLIRGLTKERVSIAPKTDKEIRDRILAELRVQKWAPVGLIGVDVDHGEVHLTGAILDERERDAIRIVAENTPGVKKVHDHLAWIGPEGLYAEPPKEEP